MQCRDIAVLPANEFLANERVLVAIGQLYGIRFVPVRQIDPQQHRAAVFLSGKRAEVELWAAAGVRCLMFVTACTAPRTSTGSVLFGSSRHLSPVLRNTTLAADPGVFFAPLCPMAGDDIMATDAGAPQWIRTIQNSDLVATPVPRLDSFAGMFLHFFASGGVSLLPLLQFTQEVSGWTVPGPRACFMFDDPNLHWRSYGYVDYSAIARQANLEQFHASFATIPMDAWWVHPPTARLFRENSQRLSLIVHGNNHTRFELHKATDAHALATQALHRIERLELKAGVRVSRIMAAPHGACSASTASALLDCGFEAACISTGSLTVRNPDATWPLAVGMQPAEFLGSLPVIPRVSFNLNLSRSRLMAFLGQPIIPVGHHQDAKDGPACLSRLAGVINAIDGVRWLDVESISRSNFCTRLVGHQMHVRMHSRYVYVHVPPQVTELVVSRPWSHDSTESLVITTGSQSLIRRNHCDEQSIPISSAVVAIRAVPPNTGHASRPRLPRTPLRAIVRRQLCEARDRCRPAFERLFNWRATDPSA